MSKNSFLSPAVFCWLLLALMAAATGQATAQVADPAQTSGERVHVVQPGETLYRIATNNSMTIERLMSLNGLNDYTIYVGQRLRLSGTEAPGTPPPAPPVDTGRVATRTPPAAGPGGVQPQPPDVGPEEAEETTGVAKPSSSSAGSVHVVEPGDTLFSIARRYGTSVATLRRLNGLSGDQINVGQRLAVSGEGAPPPAVSQRPVERRPWRIDDTTIPSDQVHFVLPGETLYSIATLYGFSLDQLTSANQLTTAPLTPGEKIYLPMPRRPLNADNLLLNVPVHEEGRALVYPEEMEGRMTTYGDTYDPTKLTASHRTLPEGTVMLVTNPASGRSTFIEVNDQGPVSQAYLIELSAAAAEALGLNPDVATDVVIRLLP